MFSEDCNFRHDCMVTSEFIQSLYKNNSSYDAATQKHLQEATSDQFMATSSTIILY